MVIWKRQRIAVAACLMAVLLCVALEGANAGKRKSKSKDKTKNADVDALKCGVCVALVELVQEEVRKKENDTTTLDLRWGLTAEVKEGRAKRLGKVIPYKRSELLATEILDVACNGIKDFGVYTGVEGEKQLIKKSVLRSMDGYEEYMREEDDKNRRLSERHCDTLTEDLSQKVINAVRDGLNQSQFVDTLCYGDGGVCGLSRSQCKPGKYSEHMGLAPCHLCPKGTWQEASHATSCRACPSNHSTAERGGKSASACMPLCLPGTYSANGLDTSSETARNGGSACTPCQLASYQPLSGQTSCEHCPDGKNTQGPGASSAGECVDVCGDGIKSGAEACDDANTHDGDGCSSSCAVEAQSVCTRHAAAKSVCNKVTCGDSKVQTSMDGLVMEECDDGNTAAADGCSPACTVEPGFKCEKEKVESESPTTCRQVVCGDGIRDGSSHDGTRLEGCDDENTEGGDGCSSSCAVEEGFICVGPHGRYSKSACSKVTCGDGFRETSGLVWEECDDRNLLSGDGCDASCRVEAGFECRQASGESGHRRGAEEHLTGPASFSSNTYDLCSRKEVCGDGFRVGSEGCDDGNEADDDGCSASCQVEPGFRCAAARAAADAPSPSPHEALPDVCVKRPPKTAAAAAAPAAAATSSSSSSNVDENGNSVDVPHAPHDEF